MFNWTIINTSHRDFPHIDYLKKTNPQAQIICANIGGILSPKMSYQNSDMLIRNWLIKNFSYIDNSNIAIFEWDTLCNMELPTNIELTNEILVKESISYAKHPSWFWFKDIDKLGEYKEYAHGLQPLGVILIDKESLSQILDQRFDKIFNTSIFSELRLPTVLNSLRVTIKQINDDRFKFIRTHPAFDSEITEISLGIYHPIKNKRD